MKNKYLLITASALSIFVLSVTTISAAPMPDGNGNSREINRRLPTVNPTREPGPLGTPVSVRTFEPKGTPVRTGGGMSCQAIIQTIKTRSGSLTKNVTDTLAKFDSILSSVENYYTGTLVPAGHTVSNYPTLVSNTQTKRSDVQKALDVATADLSSLSCDSGNIRDVVTKYGKDMRTVKSALMNYRSSIQSLIRAVHGFKVVERTMSPRPSSTPRTFILPRESEKPRPPKTPNVFFSPKPVRSIGPAVNPL